MMHIKTRSEEEEEEEGTLHLPFRCRLVTRDCWGFLGFLQLTITDCHNRNNMKIGLA